MIPLSRAQREQHASKLDELASEPAYFQNQADDDAWREAARAGAVALRGADLDDGWQPIPPLKKPDALYCTVQAIARIEREQFISGLMTAFWMISAGGLYTAAQEQILKECDATTRKHLIAFAKRNGEYRSSGMAKAIRFLKDTGYLTQTGVKR